MRFLYQRQRDIVDDLLQAANTVYPTLVFKVQQTGRRGRRPLHIDASRCHSGQAGRRGRRPLRIDGIPCRVVTITPGVIVIAQRREVDLRLAPAPAARRRVFLWKKPAR